MKARSYEQLLYRHWTHWSEGKRSHLFVVPAPNAPDQAEAGQAPRDLTEGADYDRCWKIVNEVNPYKDGGRYEHYQTLTQRRIPLVVLAT